MNRIIFSSLLMPWLFIHFNVSAQDLEPRRWTPIPLNVNVVSVVYAKTDGVLLFDPVIEITDAKVNVDTLAFVYVRSFKLADRLARFDLVLPKQSAIWNGLLRGEAASVKRTGIADPRLRLSITLAGAPALNAKELRSYIKERPKNTVVGASIAVTVPMGQYDPSKLLNLGHNRYSFRPQLGFVHTDGLWSYELTGSAFFYTDNNDFFGGNNRKQENLYAVQGHLIKRFEAGFWGSFSSGYVWGGKSEINDISKQDERNGFAYSLALGMPINRTQNLKLSYLGGRTLTDTGIDSDTFSIGWSMAF